MSVNGRPFGRWDLRRMFETDPLLSSTDRAVAIRLLASMDNKWRPVLIKLDAQAITAARVGCWRETVCRSVRKLVALGYYRTTWRTVQRRTLQGIRGVTRVQVSIGPVVRQFVEPQHVSAAQRPSVMSHHPPQTPPGQNLSVCTDVVTKRADRKGTGPDLDSESKRKTLAGWGRLAGRRPQPTDPAPRAIPVELIRDPAAYRRYLDELEQDQAARRSRRR